MPTSNITSSGISGVLNSCAWLQFLLVFSVVLVQLALVLAVALRLARMEREFDRR
jgi:hypothetical protein